MLQAIMVADQNTPLLEACAEALGTELWIPEEHSSVESLLVEDGPPLLLCSGQAHALAAVVSALATVYLEPLPGFAETLRRALPIPLCVTTAAAAGYTRSGRLVACLSAAPGACQAALELLQAVHAPAHFSAVPAPDVSVPDAEVELIAPAPAASDSEDAGGVRVSLMDEAAPPASEQPSPWQAGLQARGAVIDRDRWYALPDQIAEQAATCEVLKGAGERAVVRLPDGREVGAFGFPDLRRPSSKVLLIAMTRGVFEAVALHRHPKGVGIVGRGTLLKSLNVDDEARARTSMPTPYGGMLFATTHDAIFVERDERIYSWDGSRERDEGVEAQATASLLLRWSSR